MHLFILLSSLLVQLAFSAMPDPYFKVIFSSGEVLAEMENVPAIELKSIQPDGIFGFAFMYYANGKRIFEFMTLKMNRDQQLSDFSFVLERKPGYNCKMDNIEGTYRKLACNGEFEIRPLTADEKAQAAQIGSVLATVSNRNKFKLVQNEGKQTFLTEFNKPRYVKVENEMNEKTGDADKITVHSYENYNYDNGYITLPYRGLSKQALVIEGSEINSRAIPFGEIKGFLNWRNWLPSDELKKQNEAVPEDSQEDNPQEDAEEDKPQKGKPRKGKTQKGKTQKGKTQKGKTQKGKTQGDDVENDVERMRDLLGELLPLLQKNGLI